VGLYIFLTYHGTEQEEDGGTQKGEVR